jgi:hypothetical protein
MIDEVLGALGAVGIGVASALIPVINAEAILVVTALNTTAAWAMAGALAMAVGQTGGKLIILEAARRGSRRWFTPRHTPEPGAAGTATTLSRRQVWQAKALELLGSRWRGGGVVLLSAVVGMPPLALVSVACGTAQMRRLDFCLCCLTGRCVRFLAIALPVAQARR